MKKMLAVQHASVSPPGLLGNILEKHNIESEVVHAEQNEVPTDPTAYGAIIIFGGQEHVYDEPQPPHIAQEKQLIQSALDNNIPFLGICFGCQLLAATLGARVYPTSPARLGFVLIELTNAGRKDPLFQWLPGYQQAFQWHDDLFELPEGTQLLALTHEGEVQAFRAGKNAYGVLYHIELTEEMLHNWLFEASSKKEFIEKTTPDHYREAVAQKGLYPLYHEHASIVIENFLQICHVFQ